MAILMVVSLMVTPTEGVEEALMDSHMVGDLMGTRTAQDLMGILTVEEVQVTDIRTVDIRMSDMVIAASNRDQVTVRVTLITTQIWKVYFCTFWLTH